MQRTKSLIIIILAIFAGALPLAAQEGLEERELIYTYIGPSASFGYNLITRHDWFDDHQGTKRINNLYFSGGGIISIFGRRFVGDFTVQFMYNTGGNLTIYHLYYAAAARYNFQISEIFHIAPGGGVYLETPPSNMNYEGSGGIIIPVGFYIDTSFDTKLFFDISTRYGFFGLGEKSTRFSLGLSVGFIIKVGRI